ncbi:MAG: zinc ribbon domain-containing protein [Myxococcales bacterium]|nr:zinc ribbon domain-containing protein [Myxococcales bacterium]
MASTIDPLRQWIARHAALSGALAMLAVASVLALLRGAPSGVLWVAFGALAAAVMLFWEALRLVLDPSASGDDGDDDQEARSTAALEARKRAALRAIKDLQFERSLERITEEDFEALSSKYRAEARAAMEALDLSLGAWRVRAEAMLKQAEGDGLDALRAEVAARPGESAAPPTESDSVNAAAAPVGQQTCPQCAAANDDDAVFCKKCAARLAPEAQADA